MIFVRIVLTPHVVLTPHMLETQTIADIYSDPQWKARDMWEEIDGLTVPNMAPKLSRSPGKTRWLGRSLGEDTDDILKNRLGLDDTAIAELRKDGVV